MCNYEDEEASEVLRIPYTAHKATGAFSLNTGAAKIDDDAHGRTRHGRDVPLWFQAEKEVDSLYKVESMVPLHALGSAPEHYEVYRELQAEWWAYDVYCRISMLLAQLHILHAWSFFQVAHTITENRALWPGAVVVMCLFSCEQLILTLDILPRSGRMPLYRIGAFAPLLAYIALFLEYRRWFSKTWEMVCTVLVYAAHGLSMMQTFEAMRLVTPDRHNPPSAAEVPGAPWWPSSWKLPNAFHHSVWLVAPPRNLEPGMVDLPGEMRAAACAESLPDTASAESKQRDVHRALQRQGESPAWRMVCVSNCMLMVAWVVLTVGYTHDIMMAGTDKPSVLRAAGLPGATKDPRYRPAKPGHAHPQDTGVGLGERKWRRLESACEPGSLTESTLVLAEKLRALLPYLQWRSPEGGPAVDALFRGAASPRPTPRPTRVNAPWPAFFEAEVLACFSDRPGLIALSRRGRGAIVSFGGEGQSSLEAELTSFSLGGISHLGVLRAAWTDDALVLFSSTGAFIECSVSSSVLWHCTELDLPRLQLGSGPTAIRREKGTVEVAVYFSDSGTVTAFSLDPGHTVWLPRSEVGVPGAPAAVSFVQHQLVLTALDGSVVELDVKSGALRPVAGPLGGRSPHEWRSTCGLRERFVRLGKRLPDIDRPGELALLVG